MKIDFRFSRDQFFTIPWTVWKFWWGRLNVSSHPNFNNSWALGSRCKSSTIIAVPRVETQKYPVRLLSETDVRHDFGAS